MPTRVTNIFICDNNPLFLLGLRVFLGKEKTLRVIGEASDAETLFRRIRKERPSIVILGISIARRNDFEVVRKLKERLPGVQILLLVDWTSPLELVSAVQAGAVGYLFKQSDPSLLLRAIRTLKEGKPWIQTEFTEQIFEAIAQLVPLSRELATRELTPQERRVLEFLAQGLSNKEIAVKMQLSVRTIKVYVSRILRKLNVRNRTAAARYAFFLISPDILSSPR